MIKKIIFSLAVAALSLPLTTPAAPPSLDLKKGEHLVLIGNTFAERMQYFGYFETLVNLHHPEANPVIRNLGWSADEVTRIHLQVLKGGGYITEPTDEPVPLQPRPHQFGSLEEHLTRQKADVILLCFGLNESFRGEAGLETFAADYQAYIDGLKTPHFNGKGPARLILVSPIAHEKLPPPFPDPTRHNESLKLYTEKIAEIAEANSLGFVNLFSPTLELMARGNSEPLTMNGIHLNQTGHRVVAEIMATSLGMTEPWTERAEPIRRLVVEKNEQFFFRWRPINGEYVFGRRKDPFGVITYPPEMEQWEKMTADLDQKIWSESMKLKNSPAR